MENVNKKIMKNIKMFELISILPLLLLCMGCSNDSTDTDPPAPVTITLDDVEKAFSDLPLSEGTNDLSLEVPNNQTWQFRAIAPDISDGEKKPLFVHLHGASAGDPNAHKTTSCYMVPGLENIEAYVLSPNGGIQQWLDPINQVQVLALTNFAIKYWNVDPNKVVVVGYSNGGNGSWFFAETQPDLFSAGIPIASSYSTTNANGEVRKIDTPLFVIHGENDELFPLSETQDWVDQSVQAGSTIEFVVATGLVHNEPCSYVEYLQGAIEWLETTVWN